MVSQRNFFRALPGLALLAVCGVLLLVAQPKLDPTFDKDDLMSGAAVNPDETFFAGSSGFTGTGSPSRGGDNIQVNDPQSFFPDGLIGRSETTIVSMPGGQRLVAGWNDADGFCALGTPCTVTQLGLSGFGFSRDGGETWTDGGSPPLFDNIFTFGDPWMDRGGFDKRTIYYSSIGADLVTGQFGMSVHRGRFDGAGDFAWEDVRFIIPTVTSGPGGGDFLDKEAIATSKDGSGVVIMSLTNFLDLAARGVCPDFSPIGFGQIEVFRSTDGGNTYSGPIVVGPDLTDTVADPNCNIGVSQQSSSPAFGPHGEIYVAWERGPTFDFASSPASVSPDAEIVVAASTDGGMTFGAPVAVATVNHMRGAPPVAYNRNRINNHPRIAVAQGGAHKGRISVVFSSMVDPVPGIPVIIPCPADVPNDRPCVQQNTTSSQVFVSWSNDQGQTWSAPNPIAPPVPDTGVKRLWPTVSVEPDGTVDVTYYEAVEIQLTPDPSDSECNRTTQGFRRRAGPVADLLDTFWVRSGDGGASFNDPVALTNVTSNWCQVGSNIIPNMGDYIFSISKGNHVLATWADGRNGINDTFYATGLGAGHSGN